MKLHNETADVYVPDGSPVAAALERTTHLGIGAHQDDLEIMAFHGIDACYDRTDRWFTGVTCTSGSGSARTGPYANYSDDDMHRVRVEEQRRAAQVGRFSVALQLNYPSAVIKDPAHTAFQEDLIHIVSATRPEVVYTHNPADKHPTHIAVVLPVIQALRRLPRGGRPRRVYGCEVWRGLDWMRDEDKVALDVSAREELAARLVALFDSQIAGGKRYDLATEGRQRANATYYHSHGADTARKIAFAMDLTPLIRDDASDIIDYTMGFVNRFAADVREELRRQLESHPGKPLS